MKNSHLSSRVKELRNQKGLSQETLAEESGLSLRTIQRIENGESNPTGDTLKRLSRALNVNPDELIDWTIKEDQRYLTFMNLSALTFIFFPLLGIIVPFMLWTSRKDKLKNINKIARDLINFEITWTIALFFVPFILFLFTKIGVLENLSFKIIITIGALMYFLNIMFIIFNTLRITNKKDVVYYSIIKFLR
jgi:transcriptional regulator with XRE-family HTH domain